MFGLIASFLVSKTDFDNKYFKMEIWNHLKPPIYKNFH